VLVDTQTAGYVDTNPHPIRLAVSDDLRRSRLTVLLRLLLAVPHLVWLYLWTIAAELASIVAWFAALFTGRVPDGLHAFLAAYLRYLTQVTAYVTLLADPFPGFAGASGYPVDVVIAPPQPQSRLVVFFRLLLAIPAWIVASVLGAVLRVVAVLGWFVCLATGRMPEGMRNLGSYCLRYEAQTYGYTLLLEDRYPSFS
jgi:uncharacterized protein DUF4389